MTIWKKFNKKKYGKIRIWKKQEKLLLKQKNSYIKFVSPWLTKNLENLDASITNI